MITIEATIHGLTPLIMNRYALADGAAPAARTLATRTVPRPPDPDLRTPHHSTADVPRVPA